MVIVFPTSESLTLESLTIMGRQIRRPAGHDGRGGQLLIYLARVSRHGFQTLLISAPGLEELIQVEKGTVLASRSFLDNSNSSTCSRIVHGNRPLPKARSLLFLHGNRQPEPQLASEKGVESWTATHQPTGLGPVTKTRRHGFGAPGPPSDQGRQRFKQEA